MKIKFFCTCLFSVFLIVSVSAQAKKTVPVKKSTPVKSVKTNVTAAPTLQTFVSASPEKMVEITTPYGVMVAKLYNATPLHRDNFLKLVKEGFYDGLLFHRVINQFMIQGGDPKSKNAPSTEVLGMGSAPGDRIHAEFNPNFFHKKGALAAARDNNAERASSNCQFYIVDGKPIASSELENSKTSAPVKYNKNQEEIYSRIGGTPFLDQNYTVFGEVIIGLDVIDRIAAVTTGANNRPVQDIPMKMKLLN